MTDILDIKVAEIERHIAYLQNASIACRAHAHPNAVERLHHFEKDIALGAREVSRLKIDLSLYQTTSRPAQDTWRQLFARLRYWAGVIQSYRTVELPAYLARTSQDHYLSNIFEAMLREVGLANVYPVVSLHQSHWFAVFRSTPYYPLYFAPASLVDDPSEFGLVYHEMGHTLFALWNPDFAQIVERGQSSAIQRKVREISQESDPAIANDRRIALSEWQSQMSNEMEETSCDVVGTLLGDAAFVTALHMGLSFTGDNPFVHGSLQYPPLDCRMRLGHAILRRRAC